MYLNHKNDISYFLTVYIPISECAAEMATFIRTRAQELIKFCTFEDEDQNETYFMLQFGNDKTGGSVCGFCEDEVMDSLKKIAGEYPDCIFSLYVEDQDDGKENSTVIIHDRDLRESYSIMLDSCLSLVPEKPEHVKFTCDLTPTELEWLRTALDGLHVQYQIEAPANFL